MTHDAPILVRHLEARGRRIPIHFFRNAGGSVCGRFLLGDDDTPIIDGPTPEAVFALIEGMFDTVMLARGVRLL